MDIQIIRDGKQIGPFSEDDVHEMLKKGSVLVSDLAWRPGFQEWLPLMNVLYPAAIRPPAPPIPTTPAEPTPEAAPREPATARQKAFLEYLSIPFAPEITKESASQLVNDAMENPKDPARVARWNEDRLRLHPELFAAEIQTRKEGRPQRFLEICHEEGAAFFEKVTKAHCQVLLAHLDVHSPNWDAHEKEAAAKYFFPALAEKFPQLLTEAGKGKFKATEKSPAAAKQAKSTPVAVKKVQPTSGPTVGKALYAIGRGIFVGLIILGLLWVGRGFFVQKPQPAKKSEPTAEAAPAAPPAAEPATATVPPASTPAPETRIAQAPVEKPAAAPTAPEPAPAPVLAPAPAPASLIPTAPEPAMAAAEMKAPEVSPANPVVPLLGEVPPATASLIPSTAASLIPSNVPRTSVLLTKAIQISLPFGKISVPVGTPVRIVSQKGETLTVKYLDHEVTVPVSSTDLGTDAVPGAAPAPLLPP